MARELEQASDTPLRTTRVAHCDLRTFILKKRRTTRLSILTCPDSVNVGNDPKRV